MGSKNAVSIGIAISLLVAASCTSSSEKEGLAAGRSPMATTGLLQVRLERIGQDELGVTISNGTSRHVVFCPREDFVVCYFVSPEGKTTPITWAGSNAELSRIGPFMTVDLYPGSSYTLTKPVHDERQPGVDNRPLLAKKGTIYAVVKPVRFLDERFGSARTNIPFLDKTLSSNKLETSP